MNYARIMDFLPAKNTPNIGVPIGHAISYLELTIATNGFIAMFFDNIQKTLKTVNAPKPLHKTLNELMRADREEPALIEVDSERIQCDICDGFGWFILSKMRHTDEGL